MAGKAKYMQDHILEEHFNSIGQSFVQVNERFDKQDALLDQIARTIATILDMMASHESTINYHSAALNNHESRIGKLEKRAV